MSSEKPLRIQYLEFFKNGDKTLIDLKKIKIKVDLTILEDMLLKRYLDSFRNNKIFMYYEGVIKKLDFINYKISTTELGLMLLLQQKQQEGNERQEKINKNINYMTKFILFLTYINVVVFILDYLGIKGKDSFWPGLIISFTIAVIFFNKEILNWIKSSFRGWFKMCLERFKEIKLKIGLWLLTIYAILIVVSIILSWLNIGQDWVTWISLLVAGFALVLNLLSLQFNSEEVAQTNEKLDAILRRLKK